MYTTAYMMCMYFWLHICARWCTYIVHGYQYFLHICSTCDLDNCIFHIFVFWEIYYSIHPVDIIAHNYYVHLWGIPQQKLKYDNHQISLNAATAGISDHHTHTHIHTPHVYIYIYIMYYTFSCGISTSLV